MTTIRASACGQYVVAQIGESAPHVVSIDDAATLAASYLDDEKIWRANGSPELGAWAGTCARQIQMAVEEARAMGRRR